jgi:hypothetical protein
VRGLGIAIVLAVGLTAPAAAAPPIPASYRTLRQLEKRLDTLDKAAPAAKRSVPFGGELLSANGHSGPART